MTASVAVMDSALLDLDASGLLAAAGEAERAARLAEVGRLEVLSAWAAVHSSDPTRAPTVTSPAGWATCCAGSAATARPGCRTSASARSPSRGEPGSPLPLTPWPTRSTSSTDWRCAGAASGGQAGRKLAPPRRERRLVDSAVSRMIATEAAGRARGRRGQIIEADTDSHNSGPLGRRPPLEDPCGLPVTPVRRRSLRLAHPPRPRLPRRPHRHPPHPPREGQDDPGSASRRRHLPLVSAPRAVVRTRPSRRTVASSGPPTDVLGC